VSVRGTRRTSSPDDGVADRGAKAGRDGRVCGKKEEGARWLLKPGGGEKKGRRMGGGVWPWGATRRGGGVGPGPDRWAAPQQRPGRLQPGRGARGRRVSVSDRGAPRQLMGGPRWQWEREGEERRERHAGARGSAREEKGVVKPR
jgi:hypothetical protein